MPADIERAQRDASNPRGSVWVTANAGSGKTYVLTNRVLRLLLSGVRPEEILCLTYTKAAAAEMRGRVAERLAEWALLPDDELYASLARLEFLPHLCVRRPSAEPARQAHRSTRFTPSASVFQLSSISFRRFRPDLVSR